MLEVPVTPKMVEEAEVLAKELGVLRNSIMKGKGNVVGMIGEIVVHNHFKGSDHGPTKDYDIKLKSGTRVDVKTKKTSVTPLDHYECSIADFNTFQECDVYVFTRVHKDLDKCWILGYMERDPYYKKAVFRHKGEADFTNNFRFRADCWNLPIRDLKDIKGLK